MSVLLRPRPQAAEPGPWAFPTVERSCLSNGMGLLLCHLPDRPVVHLHLVLPGGARRDPVGAEGTAQVVGSSLFEGTGRRNVQEFNLAAEGLGAYFWTAVQWDAVKAFVSVPGVRLPAAVDLLLEAVAEPGFRDPDVERVARRHHDQLVLARAYPQHRADAAFAATAFEGGRMAFPEEGMPQSVATLTAADVRHFWRSVADPSAATLVVVGDLRGLSVEQLLDHSLGTWQPRTEASAAPPLPEVPRTGARVTVVHQPGAVQSHVAVGLARPPIPLPERARVDAGIHALAGFFSSRLMTLLREEKGITYGVSGRTDHRQPATVFRIDAPVQRDATAEAVADMLAECRTAAAGGLDPDLVDAALAHLVRTAPTRYQSPEAVARWLSYLVANDLPDDWFDRYREQQSATTPEAVAAALGAGFDPSHLGVAVVGDADRIVADLEALGHGPLTVEPMA